MDKVAIIGRGKDSTIIKCSLSTGLVFFSSSSVYSNSINTVSILWQSFLIVNKFLVIDNIGFQYNISFSNCS